MAYNIGEAVALSTILPSDQGRAFSSIILRKQDQAARNQARQDAKKQKELATLEDFKIDYTKWLPAWGKEAAVIHKDLVNKFHQYQRENPQTAANRLELDKVTASQWLNELWAGNSVAKDQYLKMSDNPKMYYNMEVGSALTNPKLNLQEVSDVVKKYNDTGMDMTPDGGFSFVGVERGDYSPYTKFDKYNEVQTEVKSDVPYHKKFDIVREADPAQVEARIQALASDPTFHKEQLLQKATKQEKEFLVANPDKAEEYILQKAREVIEPFSKIREAPIRVSFPRETEAEKKSRPRISGNTVELGNAKWTYYSDESGEIFTPSRTDVMENKVFDFEKQVGSKLKTFSGRLKNIQIGKDNKPEIHIMVSTPHEDADGKTIYKDVEKVVPYSPNNIGKIKNEFNANPYEIRAMFTGGANVISKGTGTTAKGTRSNVSGNTAKTVKSKGDDIDSWNEEIEYEVGDNIYYFDTEWKKRKK